MKAKSLSEHALKLSLLIGLGWVQDVRAEFQLPKPVCRGFDKEDVARLKPISELAMTVELLQRCGVRLPVLGELADWVWREIDGGRALTSLLLARNDFLPCCALYASCYQMGYRSSSLDAVVRTIAGSDMASVLPLQPWARLAMNHNLRKAGIPGEVQRDDQRLYTARRPEPWIMSGEIAYAVTHEVFYLTDFGFQVIPSASTGDYLRFWLPYWANLFAEEQNDDVLGEFAMCWACLADGPECVRSSPLGPVIARQAEDGSISGPTGAGAFLYSEDDFPARRRFLSSYHTTLVSLMASAMTLERLQGRRGSGRATASDRDTQGRNEVEGTLT